MSAFTDRESLRASAYADASKLATRQAIYRFIERPWPSDRGRVLGAVALREDDLVVDVGCGNGNDARQLRAEGFDGPILAFDLSPGMLQTVVPLGVPVCVADAVQLPLGDGAADVALAMHMLYHCADIAAVVHELRRVVRRGGALVVSTNAMAHLQELRALWTATLSEVVGAEVEPWRTAAGRFPLEDAPDVVARAFDDVVLQRTDNRLLVTEAEAVVAYVESTRDLSGRDVGELVWREAIERLRSRVRERIASEGALTLTVVKGIVIAR